MSLKLNKSVDYLILRRTVDNDTPKSFAIDVAENLKPIRYSIC